MARNNGVELHIFDKGKIAYLHFVPVILFSVMGLYLFKTGIDPKNFYLTHILVGYTISLIPALVAVSMYVTKVYFKDKSTTFEFASMVVGMMCFLFLMAVSYYFYLKFAAATISQLHFVFAITLSILISTFVAMLISSIRFVLYTRQLNVPLKSKLECALLLAGGGLLITVCCNVAFWHIA